MKFEESGLPDNDIVRKAFDYSYDFIMSPPQMDAARQVYMAGLQHDYATDMNELQAHADQVKDQAHIQKHLDQINQQYEALGQQAPEKAKESLEQLFRDQYVGAAKIVQGAGKKNSTELIAATLVSHCMFSALDCENAYGQGLSDNIIGLAIEVLDVVTARSPIERLQKLTFASTDAKRALMARGIASILSHRGVALLEIERLREKHRDGKLILPDDLAQSIFEEAAPLWGNDKKLDENLIKTFNSFSLEAKSDWMLKASQQNRLKLTKQFGADGKPTSDYRFADSVF